MEGMKVVIQQEIEDTVVLNASEIIEDETYRGYRILVHHQDFDTESPREWDPLWTLACGHRRYTLGDVQISEGYSGWEEAVQQAIHQAEDDLPDLPQDLEDGYWQEKYETEEEWIDAMQEWLEEHVYMASIYLMDHGGLSLSTGNFWCKWDSGQVGVAWVSKKKALKDGFKDDDAGQEAILKILEAELELYEQYINGDVYWYRILDPEGYQVAACHGYFGTNFEENNALPSARAEIDSFIKNEEK